MIDEPLNFTQISTRLSCCGQPTREQWDWIAGQGYRVVINLALSNSSNALADEADLVSARGMEYYHIPVIWEAPTEADLAQFFAVMEAQREKAVLVHCARNYRASAFVFLWRVLRCGESQADARWDMLSVWEPDATWQAFIDQALRT